MDFQELTNLVLNSTVSIVVICYFMIRDYKFMDSLQTTLTTLVNTVDTLKELVGDINGIKS